MEAEEKLQTPHGSRLVDLMLPESEREAAKAACTKSMELSDRNACDVELLCVGCALHLLGQVSRFACSAFCCVSFLLRLSSWQHSGFLQTADQRSVRVSGAFLRWRAS